MIHARTSAWLAAAALALPLTAKAAPAPVTSLTLKLDASYVGQKELHVEVELPAAPGPLTLLYPKWIPGEHSPTGPLANLVDLHFLANGQELAWQRDPVEMYAVHLEVPAGVRQLSVRANFLYTAEGGNFTSGPGATGSLAVINWNAVALYPQGPAADAVMVTPMLRLPPGWSHATSLESLGEEGGWLRFAPVSLTTLIDSPVLAGAHFVDLDVGSHGGVPHHLAIAADRAADLAGAEELKAPMSRLAEEALALFGARHYGSYHWLLALSDHVQHFGLEHHQSSDNRREEETLVEETSRRSLPSLLAHEFVHSWNGKYRRPEPLLSPSYLEPMRGELLWVYEGLTQHLGWLLPTRAGMWTADYYREQVAASAAGLDAEDGRGWRPLDDTAVAAQVLYSSPRDGHIRRRGTDFYEESTFLWLDVDTLLRERSGGKVTLDDFCHRFHGGANSEAAVKPYLRQQVIDTLNALVPYDWTAFFAERVDRVALRLNLAGVERAGWRLVFSNKPNQAMADNEARRKNHDWRFSLGFSINEQGEVEEVLGRSPAGRAGMVTGAKLLGVGGHVYSPRAVEAALAEAQAAGQAIEVISALGDAVVRYVLNYQEGPRYPHLERIEGRPDVLADILRAHATAGP